MAALKDLYIIGAGGFGREVAWLVERINKINTSWNLRGFIDDNISLHGTYGDGYQVMGGCDYFSYLRENAWVVCAVGSSKIRKEIIHKIREIPNVQFATLIDPTVQYSDYIEIGEGTIICAGTIITVDVTIGKHVIINLDCTLGHDVVVEDYVTIYPSANISGNVAVGECTELGTGMQVIQGINIGQESVVGAGAVVIRDVPDKCTVVGNPAKVVKVGK